MDQPEEFTDAIIARKQVEAVVENDKIREMKQPHWERAVFTITYRKRLHRCPYQDLVYNMGDFYPSRPYL